jgi:hypothetical protein
MPAGTYNVYAQWSSNTNRGTDIYYTIYHSGGDDTVGPFDQTVNGGTWVVIGTYSFAAGNGSVVLTDDANGVVAADAIKFEEVP